MDVIVSGDCPCSCWSCTWLFVVVLLLWTDMRNGVIYTSTSLSSVLLYVHRDCMDYYSISIGTGSPGWPPWLSHSFWALIPALALIWDLLYWCAQYEPSGATIVWVSVYYIHDYKENSSEFSALSFTTGWWELCEMWLVPYNANERRETSNATGNWCRQ